MIDFITISFRYKALFPEYSLEIGVAKEQDIPRLAEIYRNVAVTDQNYTIRLNPMHPDNFSQVGGMFSPLDETEIANIMRSNEGFFVKICYLNHIIGLLWVSLSDPDFENYLPNSYDQQQNAAIQRAIDSGKVLYFRDIIIDHTSSLQKMPVLLLYGICDWARQNGFTHSLCVVYKVQSYNDGHNHVVELFNKRSFRVILSSGGIDMGELPKKVVYSKSFSAVIYPEVGSFEHENVCSTIERNLDERNIIIKKVKEGDLDETTN